MNILETIVKYKYEEVKARKAALPLRTLYQSPLYKRQPISMRRRLEKEGATGIIAEFKRLSPSKGAINLDAGIAQVTKGYSLAGAVGLSVLTDYNFFGGSSDDLAQARFHNLDMPILRKDFIIDTFQIAEARAMGADVILLIAECLDKWQVEALAESAKRHDMEVLLEIHDESQMDKIDDNIDLVGVNNRNLKDFTVNIETALRLAPLLPDRVVKVAESGLSDPASVLKLREVGYRGFLIGEHFMKSADPALACAQFIEQLR